MHVSILIDGQSCALMCHEGHASWSMELNNNNKLLAEKPLLWFNQNNHSWFASHAHPASNLYDGKQNHKYHSFCTTGHILAHQNTFTHNVSQMKVWIMKYFNHTMARTRSSLTSSSALIMPLLFFRHIWSAESAAFTSLSRPCWCQSVSGSSAAAY